MNTSYKLVMDVLNSLSPPSNFSRKKRSNFIKIILFFSEFLVDTNNFDRLIEIWLESTKNQLID